MEASKSQDLQGQWAKQEVEEPMVEVLVWVLRPVSKENWWCKLGTTLKSYRLKARESQCFSSSLRAVESPSSCPSLEAVEHKEFSLPWGGQPFCSSQAFIGLDEAHPHWGGYSSALFRLLIQMVNPIQKHSHRLTQNSVWPYVWTSCGLVRLTKKLTITVII